MKVAFDRRRRTIVVDAQRDRRRRLPDAAAARSTPTRRSRGCWARSTAADGSRPRAELAEYILDAGRGGGGARARRSARPATCGLSYALGDDDLVEGITRLQKLLRLTRYDGRRDLRALPKAHLHLHFTGSMRHATLLELAERDGIALPDSLVDGVAAASCRAADEKGWFRFQRLYDVARSVLRTEDDVRRLVLRGGRGRRPRRRPVAGDPGRPERVRRPVRRDHRVHRPGARRRPRRRRAAPGSAWRW